MIGDIFDAMGIFDGITFIINIFIKVINKVIYYITLAVTLGAVSLNSD